MVQQSPREVADLVGAALRAMDCWHVGCGGVTLPTFSLAMGERIPRDIPLKNPQASDDFRRFTGEANLFVWCSWRLDNGDGPLSSSDDTAEHIARSLGELAGRHVLDARVELPSWDLRMVFSGSRVLHVFSDHVPGNPSFDGNWELALRDRTIAVGVGSKLDVSFPKT